MVLAVCKMHHQSSRVFRLGTNRLVVICTLLLAIGVEINQAYEKHLFSGLDTIIRFIIKDLPELLFKDQEERKNEIEFNPEYTAYAINDKSNEDIGGYSVQKIIARSGFKYKNYKVVSKDGYITRLVRIINPLADKYELKKPPVMLLHGGTIDYTTYVWASAIQHHPEPWPRLPESGPMTSWNRSLGFMLANNGYDCWLVGTRGSDIQNEGHVKYRGRKSLERDEEAIRKGLISGVMEAKKYWQYSMEEIVHNEITAQIDSVLEHTGASNVHVISYSLSTMTTLTLLGERPEYAEKIHSLVSIAPIINSIGSNDNTMRFYKFTCTLPDDLGISLFSETLLTGAIRKAMLRINSNRFLRYHFVKPLQDLALGKSHNRYLTLLEPAVVGHLFMPLSFRVLKHYFQQVIAGRLQKFDYGPIHNFLAYESVFPPKVNITNLGINNWLIISGDKDNLARPESVSQLLYEVRHPTPYKNIVIKGYNHLDLAAAINNDLFVNLPTLDFLNQCSLKTNPNESGGEQKSDK